MKWLLVFMEEGGLEPLYFSHANNRDVPVWSSDRKFVMDDGGVVVTGVEPIHFEKKEDAEALAFNFVMFDKKYMDRLDVAECRLKECPECKT